MLKVIDLHCDVLMKLSSNPTWSFKDEAQLDINLDKLKQGGVKVQAMALFIAPDIDSNKQFDEAMSQIKAFKERVLIYPEVKQIRHFSEIESLKDDEMGVFLTLEGVDCIGNSLDRLTQLLDEGVLSVGITWNAPNHACDGVMEPRGGGLTKFGYKLIDLLNERNILVDTAHISVQGFWDAINHAKYIFNSHCGVYDVVAHPRNLNADQIQALVKKGGTIHMVYLPFFMSGENTCPISSITKHINWLIEHGYSDSIGLGSDFDGIKDKVINLEDASKTQNIFSELNSSQEQLQKIASDNFLRFVHQIKQ